MAMDVLFLECGKVRCCFVCVEFALFCMDDGRLYSWQGDGGRHCLIDGECGDVERIVYAKGKLVLLRGDASIGVYNISLSDDEGAEACLDKTLGESRVDSRALCNLNFDKEGITDLCLSSDGTRICVCTTSVIYLVVAGTMDSFCGDNWQVVSFDLSVYFGSGACTLISIGGNHRMYAVSYSSHLVSLDYSETEGEISLYRDGHILNAMDRAVCIAASKDDESLLCICFESGKVHIYQADLLRLIGVLHPLVELEKRTNAALPDGDEECVINCGLFRCYEICVGGGSLTVASSHGIVRYSTATLKAVADETYTVSSLAALSGEVVCGLQSLSDGGVGVHRMTCGAGGAWLTCLSRRDHDVEGGALIYYRPTSNASHGARGSPAGGDTRMVCCDGDDAGVDAISIYAQHPLPAPWLEAMHLPGPCDAYLVHGAQSRGGRVMNRGGEMQRLSLVYASVSNSSRASAPSSMPSYAVTFGHGIRSSGYGQAPWSVQNARRRGSERKGRGRQTSSDGGTRLRDTRRYEMRTPYQDHPFIEAKRSNQVLSQMTPSRHDSAAVCTAFSADGSFLISSYHDGNVLWLSHPVTNGQGGGGALCGHSGAVWSVDTSLAVRSPLLVTGSNNGEVFVWKRTRREAPYVTHRVQGGKSVNAARFFYLDKFILYCSGNSLNLRKYVLDEGGDELHRARNESALSPALLDLSLEGSTIVAMECINHFASNLVVAATSSKSIHLVDVVAQGVVKSFDEAHTRKIHHLAMCRASRFVEPTCCAAAHQLFASAGLDGAVRLWDVRCSEAIQRFALHKNSALGSLGLAFSPSGSMIAVGSEDQRVYIYDVRHGSIALDELDCSDVPTSCAWHPIEPALAVGLASGQLKLFGQRK